MRRTFIQEGMGLTETGYTKTVPQNDGTLHYPEGVRGPRDIMYHIRIGARMGCRGLLECEFIRLSEALFKSLAMKLATSPGLGRCPLCMMTVGIKQQPS